MPLKLTVNNYFIQAMLSTTMISLVSTFLNLHLNTQILNITMMNFFVCLPMIFAPTREIHRAFRGSLVSTKYTYD